MSEHILIYITFPDNKQAEAMAEQLIEAELIACANIMQPHKAVYKWEGKIAKESEVVMLAKSRRDHFAAIKELAQQKHPYDLPCVVSIDISDANQEFLNWVDNSVK